MKRQILYYLFLIAAVHVTADSLEVQKLNELFLKYEYVNADSAKYYNDEALKVAHQSGDKALLSDVYLYRGYYFDDSGNTDSAMYFLQQSMLLAQQIEDTARIAKVYNNIGYLYSHTGDFDRALENYIMYLTLAEEALHDSSQISAALLNIGNVHISLKEYEAAEPYFLKIEKYFLREKHFLRLGFVYNSLAIVNQYKKERDLHTALSYYQKSLNVKKSTNDQSGIPFTMSNIASLYYDQEEYEKSLHTYLESIPLLEKINDAHNLCSAYKNTGMVFRKVENYAKSELYLKKGLQLAHDIKSKFYISEGYNELSILYEKWGRPNDALSYLRKHIVYKDSILGEQNVANIRKLEALYEKDQQEKEIALLNKENEVQQLELSKQNQQKIGFAIGFAIMVLIAFILYRNYQTKQRANRLITLQKKQVEEVNEELSQTNEELAAQRDEIERQKHIVEEAHQEIKDSINYAKRIQSAILPSSSGIKENLPESFILYRPKDVVAGDFYWLEQSAHAGNKGEKITLFAAADCTGHGVPGAMVSVVCHNAMNRAVREFGLTDPGKILDKTREIVLEELSKSEEDVKDGMDIALCSLKWEAGSWQLQYAGAHNPLWIVKDNSALVERKADKQPIGKTEVQQPFKTHFLELMKGDVIYLFSDGYVDQFGGEEDKKFGSKRFKELLISIHGKSMHEQHTILNSTFEDWINANEGEQIDDVCVMGVRI